MSVRPRHLGTTLPSPEEVRSGGVVEVPPEPPGYVAVLPEGVNNSNSNNSQWQHHKYLIFSVRVHYKKKIVRVLIPLVPKFHCDLYIRVKDIAEKEVTVKQKPLVAATLLKKASRSLGDYGRLLLGKVSRFKPLHQFRAKCLVLQRLRFRLQLVIKRTSSSDGKVL